MQAQPAELPTASLQALKQRAHQLLESQRSLQQQNQALAAERLSFQSERDQLATQHQALSAERDALQAERDSLSAQLQELTAQRDSIQQQRETLQKSVEDLQGQLTAQSGQTAEQSQQREVLQARVDELQDQLTAQNAQMEEQSQQREVLHTRVEELQSRSMPPPKDPVESRVDMPSLIAYDWSEFGLETDGRNWKRGPLSTRDLFSLIADERSPQGFFVAKRSRPSELCRLFDFYGSDKGSNSTGGLYIYGHSPHSYGDIYEHLFCGIKENNISLLECGIGSANLEVPSNMGLDASPGASLRAWRDYFPNASIYGCDIDKSCLIEEDRISSGYADQLEIDSIAAMWEGFGRPLFDIVIDDGLHTADAATSLFRGLSQYLSKTGIYIIEDVAPVELIKIDEFLCASRVNYTFYAGLRRQKHGSQPAIDDNIMIVISACEIGRSVAV